jgi:hypothetical protein
MNTPQTAEANSDASSMVFSEQNLQYAFLPVKPKLCNSTQH